MKSKFNPFLFRTLATGAALFAIASLHAADVDTTPGVTLSVPGNKYIGTGTLTVSGGGDVWLGNGGGDPSTEFAMTGGLIDIVSGTTLKNAGWQKGVWTDNKATLQVNGALDVADGNNIFADALTGSGTVIIPSGITWFTLNTLITVGVNGGGGTFTGTISDSDDDTLSLIKTGGGTQILTGPNTYRGATTINGGTLKLQGAAFSTTARAYSIASGAVLNLDGSTGVAWGNTTISGTGTLRISGGWQGSGDDGRDLTLALGSGAVIEIQPGAALYNGGWQNMTWTDNKASLQVDGTLEMTNGNWINADALTGSGAVTMDVSWAQWANSLTVGVNGGGGTFTGTISDSGDDTLRLTKTGGGTQILTGTNSYRDSTNVNGGTLSLGNGGTTGSLSISSAISVGSGATFVINQSDTVTQGTDFSSAAISGAGGFTQAGAGTTVLNATNTYTGATTVSAGTLSLGNGTTNTALANTADVTVDSGCTLNLNYTGTDTIDELWLGGVQRSPGTYGAGTYSGVTITGAGTLTVQNGPPADPFANWMSTNYPAILTPDNEPGADPDNDGIANLMEYVLQGGDPSVSTTGTLPTLDASGANFVFTYYRRAAATGTSQTFEYGNDLIGWTPVAIPGGAGVSVTDQGAGIDKVEITVAKGAETKLFGRLQVVK